MQGINFNGAPAQLNLIRPQGVKRPALNPSPQLPLTLKKGSDVCGFEEK